MFRNGLSFHVIPAKAGISGKKIPAFAGMTGWRDKAKTAKSD
jgi:hypothetical protein